MVPSQPQSPQNPQPQPRQLPATAGETTAEQPWPVRVLSTKLADYISRAPGVWVEGQIVQIVRRPGQNTAYLTLRDPDVDMSFQVTASTRLLDTLDFALSEGARVVIHAKPQFWPQRGSLNLSADAIRPVGVGELLARLEHLRRLLASEGVFAADRKRPLPFLPRVVGLICGRASAAERDVVDNARRRWPAVRFSLRQVAVQGPNAVSQVTQALTSLDAEGEVDVIVIARGGGSLEDLLPFSNEALVRAVAACRTPVVSAIGHESDTPLLDLVADVRASTPTDAAKRIVPDVEYEVSRVVQARDRVRAAVVARVTTEQRLLDQLRARPALAAPEIALGTQAELLESLTGRTARAVRQRIERAADDVTHLRERVRALSPAATLARGYAVVQTADRTVVRTTDDAPFGTDLLVRLAEGTLAARSHGPASQGS